MRPPRILRQLDILTSDAHGALLDGRQRFITSQEELSETLAVIRRHTLIMSAAVFAVALVAVVAIGRTIE